MLLWIVLLAASAHAYRHGPASNARWEHSSDYRTMLQVNSQAVTESASQKGAKGWMKPAGQQQDKIWKLQALSQATDSLLTASVPAFVVNLDLPPEERWTEVTEHYRAEIYAMTDAMKPKFQAHMDHMHDLMKDVTFDPEYEAELKGIAKTLNRPDISVDLLKLVNIVYELDSPSLAKACSGVLWATINGTVLHGRNMDYTMRFEMPDGRVLNLPDVTSEVTFTKGGKPFMKATHWPGSVGIHTAMRFGGWSYEQNTRRQKHQLQENLSAMKKGGLISALVARRIMETTADFKNAVGQMYEAKFAAPQYFIMAGSGSFEGAVLTLDRLGQHASDTPPIQYINGSPQGSWHLVQTNDDFFHKPSDIRRPVADMVLQRIAHADATVEHLFQFMHTEPVFNTDPSLHTVFTAVMVPATGFFRTILPGDPPHPHLAVSQSSDQGAFAESSQDSGAHPYSPSTALDKVAKEGTETYFWPSGRGAKGSYSKSPFKSKFNLSDPPSWSWHHPAGLWSTIPVGTNIDHRKNIYLTAQDGIRKFSPDGKLLWTSSRSKNEIISKVAALMDGAVHCISEAGRVFAVSMDTGKELWSTFVSDKGSDGNYGQVMADAGIVIAAAEVSGDINRTLPSCCGDMNHNIYGLNGTDGSILWTYTPEIPVWNFGSAFTDEGTFIYQDLEGRAHCNRVSDGKLLWKAGGIPESWTDGQANLGPNGIVYAVANYGMVLPGTKGCLSAYNVSDGKMLWRHDLPKSPNSVPAIGQLAGHSNLSVVMPIGMNDQAGARIDVYALDAETGELQWIFEGPTQKYDMGLGDATPGAKEARLKNKISPMTLPNSWGIPIIDGDGIVHVGGITGHLFSLLDANGDGNVTGSDEVSKFTTSADFVGSSGPALAPGLLAAGSANSLLVWQY